MQREGSKVYRRSLEDQRAHHARSKTFSGSLMEPYVPKLAQIIEALDVVSVLDYGCGKARAWIPQVGEQSLQARLKIGELALYDPAFPPYDWEGLVSGDKRYDLVIVSHVLFWIPEEDLRAWVLERIFGLATKAVFFAEKIGPAKKQILSDQDQHPQTNTAAEWLDLLAPYAAKRPDLQALLAVRYLVEGRSITGMFAL